MTDAYARASSATTSSPPSRPATCPPASAPASMPSRPNWRFPPRRPPRTSPPPSDRARARRGWRLPLGPRLAPPHHRVQHVVDVRARSRKGGGGGRGRRARGGPGMARVSGPLVRAAASRGGGFGGGGRFRRLFRRRRRLRRRRRERELVGWPSPPRPPGDQRRHLPRRERPPPARSFCVFTEAADDLPGRPPRLTPPSPRSSCRPSSSGSACSTRLVRRMERHRRRSASMTSSLYRSRLRHPVRVHLAPRADPGGVRFALAPHSLRRPMPTAPRRKAFLSHGIHTTQDRTGVLIFLSRRDHVAEIARRRGHLREGRRRTWGAIVADIVDRGPRGDIAAAFLVAIEASGVVPRPHTSRRATAIPTNCQTV